MPRRSSRDIDGPEDFYEEALSEAERPKLKKASRVKGVDQEIALLRLRLMELAREQPEKLELLMKGIGLLLRAVALKYKLSPEAEENLSSSIAGVLREVGGLLVTEQVSEH